MKHTWCCRKMIKLNGVEPTLTSHLIAEITCFPHRGSLSSFTGIDMRAKYGRLDNPVYRFIDERGSEGKSYYNMTTGTNKFLHIYYRHNI